MTALTLGKASSGLDSLAQIVTTAQQVIADKGSSLPADAALTHEILSAIALVLPQAALLDDALQVSAVVIPVVVAMNKRGPDPAPDPKPPPQPGLEGQTVASSETHGHYEGR